MLRLYLNTFVGARLRKAVTDSVSVHARIGPISVYFYHKPCLFIHVQDNSVVIWQQSVVNLALAYRTIPEYT